MHIIYIEYIEYIDICLIPGVARAKSLVKHKNKILILKSAGKSVIQTLILQVVTIFSLINNSERLKICSYKIWLFH